MCAKLKEATRCFVNCIQTAPNWAQRTECKLTRVQMWHSVVRSFCEPFFILLFYFVPLVVHLDIKVAARKQTEGQGQTGKVGH
ncbi:Periplasmic sensor hybrid histidine kinase [Anopheles sinensis]|uniref:Periplasmic sensor hybrid histidine kinase n=1 Tax=Anopheles sinensis TaxID=74873 RepID=A0A084VRK0_ANOSI|nr:Periplasmic sensor hybrid histidine kinase [Anopheles sinensis]